MEDQIKELLDQLHDVRQSIETTTAVWDEKEYNLIPKELRNEMESLKEQREKSLETLRLGETNITKKVKELVVQHGEPVKGEDLHAIFNGGRVTWNSKGLAGFMVAHPEIEAFRKVGKPFTTIRKVKK